MSLLTLCQTGLMHHYLGEYLSRISQQLKKIDTLTIWFSKCFPTLPIAFIFKKGYKFAHVDVEYQFLVNEFPSVCKKNTPFQTNTDLTMPFTDQNSSKTIAFGAVPAYNPHTGESPLPSARGKSILQRSYGAVNH